ncbi:hypothetical protein QTO34_015265 [Cnephaeus nilssonii]|uniref:U6 snRNA-associated Sm-like protein LSm4 n=1 Tax=Cnephaeus nilssonii TaxID=3371016 RepID=A0AA40I4S5_CNENI|nr:hypothetical protein QTO34_015265 [Eptesicus nilssonii]
MNINLREVICTSRDGDKFWRMPECYIRGSTIKYLRIPDEIIDMVKEEVVAKGRGRGGLQQQKQQKGRGMGGAGRVGPWCQAPPGIGSVSSGSACAPGSSAIPLWTKGWLLSQGREVREKACCPLSGRGHLPQQEQRAGLGQRPQPIQVLLEEKKEVVRRQEGDV